MVGFRADLCSEIKFAKSHFDFIEITIPPEVLKEIDNVFYDIKDVLGDSETLGHIHWKITDFGDIAKNIEALKRLGAKKVTIHPFQDLSIEENVRILNQINSFSKNNKIELLIENVSNPLYGSVKIMAELFERVPGACLTLDVGHANRNSELDGFINNFAPKIKHVHLHYNIGDSDHLFYDKKEELDKILSKISSFGYDGTVLLETFSVMENGKSVSQGFSGIKKLQTEQLEKIRTYDKNREIQAF